MCAGAGGRRKFWSEGSRRFRTILESSARFQEGSGAQVAGAGSGGSRTILENSARFQAGSGSQVVAEGQVQVASADSGRSR